MTICVTHWARHDRPRGRRLEINVDDLFHSLARPFPAKSKSTSPGWAPVTFADNYRRKANVERVFAIGIDIDGGDTAAAIAAWMHVWGCWHTTASSATDEKRIRIVVILSSPIDCASAERVIVWAQRRTPGKVDRGTKDPSRLWYLPWAGAAHFEHGLLDGDPLDPDPILAQLEAEERAARERPKFEVPRTTGTGYAHAALRRACDAIGNASEGERHDVLTREAWNIGTLVGAGLLSRDEAHAALDVASRHVLSGAREDERARTLAGQLDLGAKSPREIRKSSWAR